MYDCAASEFFHIRSPMLFNSISLAKALTLTLTLAPSCPSWPQVAAQTSGGGTVQGCADTVDDQAPTDPILRIWGR